MSNLYFETRERALLGDEFDRLYKAPERVCRAVTVNLLRTDAEQFAEKVDFVDGRSPFCLESFYLKDDMRPGRHPYHHAGVYYVQEASAAGPAALLNIQPGDRVMDLCAAPGGKSSQLGAKLRGKGILVSNEYMAPRAQILKNNLERMGIANSIVLNEDAERIARLFPEYFNKILVDAPCSGEGMFRKEEQAVRQHSQALVKQCAALGAEILESAARCLAPGGLLCYSTCTFSPEEDEGQIGQFLARHPEFSILPARLSAGTEGEPKRCGENHFDASKCWRIYPCHGGEGHFMALLKKQGASSFGVATRIKGKSTKECDSFLKEYFGKLPGTIFSVGERIYLLPEDFPSEILKLKVLRCGVELGSMAKGRFVPAHGLVMAFGGRCRNVERLSLDDSRTQAWLRGEEIAAGTSQNGWTAVLVDGFPLGWGKCSGGRVENHYPKGLRNLG
ncbi:RsmB/NOP family class I SAM-dependent RNA methyltransferase [uncultured Ruthenibacterium sp.]|uniref:RsmB/NOP family class I SAM-dependent RNA methyltransferase n=1 Tax=uncultured Ruthenibacterium sp. TaxID=1905347 RepID=UPI00349EC0B3